MKLAQFRFLADENIDAEVVARLRAAGWDLRTLAEEQLLGAADTEVMSAAHRQDRVVLTHDSDFGRLAILAGVPCIGVFHVRPGHLDPEFTLATIRTVVAQDLELVPPFVLVASRSHQDVTVRLRRV